MRFAWALLVIAACSSRPRPPAEATPPDADAAPVDAATIDAPAAPPPVAAIGVGEHLSCALLVGGEVRCWGATRLTAAPVATTPVAVGIADAVSLGVGTRHVCVARTDGTVWCWGDNRDNQLGDGTTDERGAPQQVAGVAGIVEVAAGGIHTCARDGAGAVWCWGHPGAVGHAEATPADRPARVTSLAGATHLYAGDDITCALVDGGPPRCWGFNTTTVLEPALGPVLRATPSKALAGARTIGLGYRTACFAGADRRPWCAGSNQFGQLGDQRVPDDARCDPYAKAGVTCTWSDPEPAAPAHDPRQLMPRSAYPPPRPPHTKVFPDKSYMVPAAVPLPVVALAAGDGRTCAITEGGAVWCWGQQYSAANEWSHRTPAVIVGAAPAVAIAVAQEHACALLADQTVRCWGYDRSGELGDGRTSDTIEASATATPVRW